MSIDYFHTERESNRVFTQWLKYMGLERANSTYSPNNLSREAQEYFTHSISNEDIADEILFHLGYAIMPFTFGANGAINTPDKDYVPKADGKGGVIWGPATATGAMSYQGVIAAPANVTANSTGNTYLDGGAGIKKGDVFYISASGDITVSDGTIPVDLGDMLVANKDVAADADIKIADFDKIDNTEEDHLAVTADIALQTAESVTAFAAPANAKGGATLVSGTSRILLTNQADPAENGIWIYKGDGQPLERPTDYSDADDRGIGHTVYIKDGDNKGSEYVLSETGNADKETVVIDTDTTKWIDVSPPPLKYNKPVDIALKSEEVVSAFVSSATHEKDGVTLVAGTSRILLTGQTTQSENGIWVYKGNGIALERPIDYSSNEDHIINEDVMVKNGSYKGERFILSESGNADLETAVIDTDNTIWTRMHEEEEKTLTPVAIALKDNESVAAFQAAGNSKDGETLVSGTSRILLTGQTNAAENGIWVYNGHGNQLTRPLDYSTAENHVINEDVMVKGGSYKGARYILSETNHGTGETVVVDTSETVWFNSMMVKAKTDNEDDYTTANDDGLAAINPLEFWVGEQTEYNGITTKQANTIYFISND